MQILALDCSTLCDEADDLSRFVCGLPDMSW
jgi:hypothetical protein